MPARKKTITSEETEREVDAHDSATITSHEPKLERLSRRSWFLVGMGVAVAVVVVILLLTYRTYMSPEAIDARTREKVIEETETLLRNVGDLMVLPQGETPIIYEVNDPDMLKRQQPFFTGSGKGDKLIIYPNAVKAILYSPTQHKIINVGPITFDGDLGVQSTP
jgi:hypothetical protein